MAGSKFRCRDLGFKCDFEVSGVATREEMLGIIESHAKRCHGLAKITPDVAMKVSRAIRE